MVLLRYLFFSTKFLQKQLVIIHILIMHYQLSNNIDLREINTSDASGQLAYISVRKKNKSN